MNLEEALEAIDKIEANARRAGNPDLVLCWGVHRWGHEIVHVERPEAAREMVRWWFEPNSILGEPSMVSVFVCTGRFLTSFHSRRLDEWVPLENARMRFAEVSRWQRHFAERDNVNASPEYDYLSRHVEPLYDGDPCDV